MDYLGKVILAGGKGDRHGLYHVDGPTGCRAMAFVWADRDRRYFISTCSNIQPGVDINRSRWKQVDKAPNAVPNKVNLNVEQPKACEIYYSACSMIDRHNRCRQAGLMLEKKIKVQTFDKRVNLSLFGMVVVDSLHLFQKIRQGSAANISERAFFERLSEQLIDNTFDTRQLRHQKRTRRDDVQQEPKQETYTIPSTRQLLGVTPTKRHKKGHPKHLLQGRCGVCQSLATTVCRECQSGDPLARHQVWMCNKPDKVCMGRHIMAHHPDMVAPSGHAKRAINYNHVI